jgi:O-antigen ligase
MPTDFKTLHLRICLGAVVLMVTVPFLMAHHFNPIPTFFQEWTAAALGLVALTALFRRGGEGLEIPEVALLPVGLLAVAVLQWLFLPAALADRMLTFGCYMLWALFLIVLGRHLARTFGLSTLVDIMAAAILAGALLEAVSGVMQLVGVARQPWAFPIPGGGLQGNLAQANSFADYLWLGIGSAVYLRSRRRLPIPLAAISFLVLLPVVVLSGSRSIWLYGVGLVLLSFAWSWKRDDPTAKALRNWSVAALAGGMFFHFSFTSGLIPLPDEVVAFLKRITNLGARDPMRLALWRIALVVFSENPWLGAGFGQYARQFYLHAAELLPLRIPTFYGHAHNILFNLLAEMGLAAGLLLLAFGLRWVMGLVRAPRSPEVWWIAATALLLGLHSGLEYPLWYAFFLGIAALLAGAGSQANRPLPLGRGAPYLLGGFLVLGVLALLQLHRDYSRLEDVFRGRVGGGSPALYRVEAVKILDDLAKGSLLSSYALVGTISLMTENAAGLESKLRTCDRAQQFLPHQTIVFKCAHFLALAGRHEEASRALRQAVAAYPDRAELVLEQWMKRSWNEPAIAGLLAEFPPIAERPAK